MDFDFLTFGIVRLIAPLLILRAPLPGILLAIYIDWLDWRVLDLDNRPGDHGFYQAWDKLLDTYYLSLALLVSLRWQDRAARTLALALFGWRLAGVALFTATGAQPFLFVFPNLFENFFVLFYVYRYLAGHELALGGRVQAGLVVVAILVPQLAREYFLHVLEDRPWDMIRLLAARELDVMLWYGFYLLPQAAALAYLLRGVTPWPRWKLLLSR